MSADLEVSELDIHETYPLELYDPVPEIVAHLSYLPVKTLLEDYLECMRPRDRDGSGESDLTVDGNTVLHLTLKVICYFVVYSYDIFLLVTVLGSKELIYDISVIGKEDQS